LAVRQEAGGVYVIALSFRNVAKLEIPVSPRNFSNYGGILLSPRLFVALYLSCNIYFNSIVEMWWFSGFDSGVY
jgi:hypothetical protein